jgi:hypothetical protein
LGNMSFVTPLCRSVWYLDAIRLQNLHALMSGLVSSVHFCN